LLWLSLFNFAIQLGFPFGLPCLSLTLELLSRWLALFAVWLVCLVGLPSVPYFEVAVA
jgi:hypothetical protein